MLDVEQPNSLLLYLKTICVFFLFIYLFIYLFIFIIIFYFFIYLLY